MGDIATLFAPERVAVVGTSEDGSIGSAVMQNLAEQLEDGVDVDPILATGE